MITELAIAIRSTLVFWVLTAMLYPLLILIIGFVFPYQANGSLITDAQGQIIGSALIGQSFNSDRYFWSRPSTTNYSEGEGEDAPTTGISGASNLAPSNPDLLKRIQADATKLELAGIQPIADLLYTSGSSLDPHISLESATAQAEKIAKVRGISPKNLDRLIKQNTEGRFLGIFGEPGVNVLKLNLALDALKSPN
ncbi:K(+)-transporting ATPase subunit C [Gloeocapsa sp. PCC 73106]|uniref:K(+)-transporting ATPase subunit C n=1 Tax=Gloeocapsa sp. PCC 73106 TaxID=102232 RepID=UPI0002AC35B9|nr:K(+)-transporting ATPase subunit C [Gloeocapsa sp. PCC 73106]ELR99889.1 K+-transporting ATPase, C subunit [Gloeocapsa sp. PCC 73106]